MRKVLCLSALAATFLLLGLAAPLVFAAGLPEIPKPSLPSLPSIPSVPSVPSIPGVPAAPAAVTTAPPATMEQRIENQQKRIELGLKTKQLTQAEAKTLQENLSYIKTRETRFKADGLGASESELLTRLADQNSRMIDNKKAYPIKPLRDIYYDLRIEQHQDWIKNGTASGQLTKEEAKEVQADLDKIRARYANLTKDGKLTAEERDRLDEMLARNTRMIQKKEQPPAKK